MNIYKRQMERLGLNLEQYSKLIGMPIEITEKLINEKEVVEDMKVNDFLRNNIFNKHQEIEKSDIKKEEAINMKLENSDVFSHPKIQALIEQYPESVELYWYLTKFNKEEYFEKYNVAGYRDLMRRYDFYTLAGKCRGKIDVNTLSRVINKKYNEVGIDPLYTIVVMLYDCFEKGNITNSISKKPKKSKLTNSNTSNNELLNWYYKFDIKDFTKNIELTNDELSKKLGIAYSTLCALKAKTYTPSNEVLQKLKNLVDEQTLSKDYVESCDKNIEQITIEETMQINDNTTIISTETGIGIITDENSMLKELLKERLTEQEKYLIRLFGGNI